VNQRGDFFWATKVSRLYLLFGAVSFGASEATIFSKRESLRGADRNQDRAEGEHALVSFRRRPLHILR
jgi:hypothetical protein